jgi:hypothetical protein
MKEASVVDTSPTSSATITVLVEKTRLLVGNAKPSASNRPVISATKAIPPARPMSDASRPITRASSSTDDST